MNKAEIIKKMIEKYGRSITVLSVGNPLHLTEGHAFIQPLRYKNKMYLRGTFSDIGYSDQAYYLYIGPADINICSLPESATIEIENKSHVFTRRECVTVSDSPVYYWAVLRAVTIEGETL